MEIRRSHPLAPISETSAKKEKPRDGYLRDGRESWCPGGRCLGEESKGVRTLHCAPGSAFLPPPPLPHFPPDAGRSPHLNPLSASFPASLPRIPSPFLPSPGVPLSVLPPERVNLSCG